MRLSNYEQREQGEVKVKTLGIALVAAVVLLSSGLLMGGEPTKFTLHKSIFEVTDKDIAKAQPFPGEVWTLKKREGFGHWLHVYFVESPSHAYWDPIRSPGEIEIFRRMGYDAVTAYIDTESFPSLRGTDPPRSLSQDDPRINKFYIEWQKRTGRGLIVAQQNVPRSWVDGEVRKGGRANGRREPAGWNNNCFSSPKTIEYYIRRIKGIRRVMGNLSSDEDGTRYVAFRKEVNKQAWPNFYNGKVILGSQDKYSNSDFRRYLKQKYGDIKSFNKVAGQTYTDWSQIEVPIYDMRFVNPQLHYEWMRFRVFIRRKVALDLITRAGMTNIVDTGTSDWSMWGAQVNDGMDIYESAMASKVVPLYVSFSPYGPNYGAWAALDAVACRYPKKRFIMVTGGGPSYWGMAPGQFFANFADALGSVTRVRGMLRYWWDHPYDAPLEWIYSADQKYYPAAVEAASFFSHFGELQHELLSGLKTKDTQIAVYFPEVAMYFERLAPQGIPGVRSTWIFDERSKLWNSVFSGFKMTHYPVHTLLSKQIEDGWLKGYKVLYINYGPKATPAALQNIRRFYDRGGYVYGSFDALSEDIKGPNPKVFEHIFHARLASINRGSVLTYQSRIIPKPHIRYKIVKANPALPPVGTVLPSVHGFATLKPLKGGIVYARTLDGRPIIVGSERSLFVGTDIGTDLAFCAPVWAKPTHEKYLFKYPSSTPEEYRNMLKVLTGFAAYAGVKKPLTILRQDSGMEPITVFTGVQEEPETGKELITLANYDSKPVELSLSIEKDTDSGILDLTTGKRLSPREKKYNLQLPGYGYGMLVVDKEEKLSKYADIQRLVRKKSKVYEFESSRYFFIRKDDTGETMGLGCPATFMKPTREIATYPQAIIVLPDNPRRSDLQSAAEIQKTIFNLPVFGTLGKTYMEKPVRLDITIPIKRPAALSPEELRNRNLLFVGGPEINSACRDFLRGQGIITGLTRYNAPGIRSIHKRAWREGGNALIVGGTEKDRTREMEQLWRWINLWFDRALTPLDPKIIAEEIVKRIRANPAYSSISMEGNDIYAVRNRQAVYITPYSRSYVKEDKLLERLRAAAAKGHQLYVVYNSPYNDAVVYFLSYCKKVARLSTKPLGGEKYLIGQGKQAITVSFITVDSI